MKNAMSLNKLGDNFSETATAKAFAAAIQSRVVNGREVEIALSQPASQPVFKKMAGSTL